MGLNHPVSFLSQQNTYVQYFLKDISTYFKLVKDINIFEVFGCAPLFGCAPYITEVRHRTFHFVLKLCRN